MTVAKQDATTAAFGVEPGYAPYRLRQARYPALAEDVARLAAEAHHAHRAPLRLLDVGVNDGVSRRYIEVHDSSQHIEWHGVDIFPKGREYVYKHHDWKLYEHNLEAGPMPLPDNSFDVVLCEQVLEHLHGCEAAAQDLVRVLKPGGVLVVGVPIFPPGLDLVRKHLVPLWDRLTGSKKKRGHVQAFTLGTFQRMLRRVAPVELEISRGFRMISGGPLRKLEYHKWWWRFNRWLGALAPALCVETQVVAIKQGALAAAAEEEPVILKFDPALRERRKPQPAAGPKSRSRAA